MARRYRWLAVLTIGCCVAAIPAEADNGNAPAKGTGGRATGPARAPANYAPTSAAAPHAAAPPAAAADLLTEAASSAAATGGRHPDVFGGVWIDRQDGVVNVALTSPRPALESSFAGSYDRALFRFPIVRRSWADLGKIRDSILVDVQGIRARGIELTGFYPKASTNKVVLEVVAPTAAQIAELTQRYGAETITVVAVKKTDSAVFSRAYDSAPWNGGDFIASRIDGVTCSSGPPGYRQVDGRKFLITAGHCWPASRYVFNESRSPSIGGSGAIVGQTAYNDYATAGGLDVAIIDAQNYGGSSKRDWRSDAVSAAQQSWSDPPENGSVCTSGAYEGEVCPVTVTSVDGCYFHPDASVHCHETRAVNYGKTVAGQGDSGGPIYGVDVNTLKLRLYGEISFGEQLYTCPTLSEPLNPRLCSHIVYFTDVVPILQKYGMALNR